MEIWKDIKNFEGLYQVSNLGRVKCLEHKCPGRYKGKYRTVKEHMMTCVENKTNGYLYVALSNLDRGRTFTVHRLVANAFIPNPENKPVLNHKDENKHNNCVDNLEWCTSLYNNTYKDVHLKRKYYWACSVVLLLTIDISNKRLKNIKFVLLILMNVLWLNFIHFIMIIKRLLRICESN